MPGDPPSSAAANAAVPLRRLRADQRLQVCNATRSSLVVQELSLALSPWRRLRGLLGLRELRPGQGLLLPCNGVHTLFMTFAIDVLFLDDEGRVVELRAVLPPWRATPLFGAALAALELPAGQAATTGTTRGDRLIFEPAGEPTCSGV